jgi:hypothetical protein
LLPWNNEPNGSSSISTPRGLTNISEKYHRNSLKNILVLWGGGAKVADVDIGWMGSSARMDISIYTEGESGILKKSAGALKTPIILEKIRRERKSQNIVINVN